MVLMEFPLGLISDYLDEVGYEVVHRPVDLRRKVSWVSSSFEEAQSHPMTLPKEEGMPAVLVVSSIYRIPDSDRPLLLLCAGSVTLDIPHAFVLSHVEESPAAVAARIQRYLISIYEWVERMHLALENHCDCGEILRLSEPMLRNFVSVSDSLFAYIAHTPGIAPLEEASKHLIEYGRYSDEIIEKVRDSGLSEKWLKALPVSTYENNAINPFPSIEHVYHLNNQYAAHLVMVSPNPITVGQEFLFSLIIGPIGAILKSQWQATNPLRHRYATFLSNLLHEDRSNKKTTYDQAKMLGIPTEGLFKVCVVDQSWKGGSSSYFAARAVALVPGCYVVLEQDRLVLLLCAVSRSGKNELTQLEQRVFKLAEGLGTQVGVSSKFYDLIDVAAAYSEAEIALKYGKICHKDFAFNGLTGPEQDNGIYRFKRYFPYFVGDPTADLNLFIRRHNIATKVLGRIERDDLENGTADIKVLRAYLYSGCNIKEASRLLGMHRNSFTYRLRHIEEVYRFDLDDADERVFIAILFTLPR